MATTYNDDGTPTASAKLRLAAAIKAATKPTPSATRPTTPDPEEEKVEEKEDGEVHDQVSPVTSASLFSHDICHIPTIH